MAEKTVIERELKRAKSELFTASSLKEMKFIQKKIAYLQSKMREGV